MSVIGTTGHFIEFIQDIPQPFTSPCSSVKYQDSSRFKIQVLSKEHVLSLSLQPYSVWLGNLGAFLWICLSFLEISPTVLTWGEGASSLPTASFYPALPHSQTKILRSMLFNPFLRIIIVVAGRIKIEVRKWINRVLLLTLGYWENHKIPLLLVSSLWNRGPPIHMRPCI